MACCDHENKIVKDVSYKKVLYCVLFVNVTFFMVEIMASYWSGSVALVADAVDFLSDSANYIITLYVLSKSAKIRAWAALIKAYSMIAFGFFVFFLSIYNVFTQSVPTASIMGWVAGSACMANIFCAVLLYRYRFGDSNRESAWLCSRNDAVSNVVVVLAALVISKTQSPWPDILVALGLSFLYIGSARHIRKVAKAELQELALEQGPHTK